MRSSESISIWAKPPKMGVPPTKWYAKNEHDEDSFRCEFLFWTMENSTKKEWSKTITLASGEGQYIGPKYDSNGKDIRVRLKGVDSAN